MKNEVAIIVVTYNRIELLKECVDSLRNQTYKNRDIIIVNNGSTDETPNWLASQKDLKVITQENLGGAGGFYTGLKYFASEDKYSHVWLMDDDTEPQNDALEKLMEFAIKENELGFLCGNIFDLNNLPCNVPVLNSSNSKNNEPIYLEKSNIGLLSVLKASFVSVLIPKETVCEVGLPYKEFFIWGDDFEYTNRISKKHPSYLVLNSITIHKRLSQSSLSIFKENNPNRIFLYYYLYRNHSFIYGQTSKIKKIIFIIWILLVGLYFLITGNLLKAKTMFKAAKSSIHFNPQIDYIQCI